MPQPTTLHNTFVLERHFSSPAAQVFSALSDPAKKRRWFAEGHGNAVEKYESDFQVGGWERTHSRFGDNTPFPGGLFWSEAVYLDIVQDQRIVMAGKMGIGDRGISASLATFELVPTDTGTDLIFTHQAAFYEGSDGPEMRKHGWLKLFEHLDAQLA